MSGHEERELRLVHRIESFSDLVIGFSLALLTLTLVIPDHAVQLLLNPVWLVSYLWTFGWIASTWFGHQRLFSLYFVPSAPAIVINFVLLASLALGVYFVQVFLHFERDADKAIALLLYFAALSVTLLSLGALYALGTRARWQHLSATDRYGGVARAVRLLTIGIALIVGILMTPRFFIELRMQSTLTLGYAAIAGVVAARLLLLAIKPRILGAAHAAA